MWGDWLTGVPLTGVRECFGVGKRDLPIEKEEKMLYIIAFLNKKDSRFNIH